MVKILFLDIDGVLNIVSIDEGRDQYGQIFHKHFVDNLQWIIEQTDAKIVISSDWKSSGLVIIKEMWKNRNLPGDIIDVTTYLGDDFSRGHEIQDWIDNHRDSIESYVIIDDTDCVLEHQLPFFVRTSSNVHHEDSIGLGYGLTKQCAKTIVEILNRK